jgi:hypothetical protein
MDAYLLSSFEDFASCDLSLSALHERVRDALGSAFRHNPNFAWVDLNQVCAEPSVRITPKHVQRALEKRRQDRISDQQLIDWATMILINHVFYWEPEHAQTVAGWVNALCLDFRPQPSARSSS